MLCDGYRGFDLVTEIMLTIHLISKKVIDTWVEIGGPVLVLEFFVLPKEWELRSGWI